MIPSVKTIVAIGCSNETAGKIRTLIENFEARYPLGTRPTKTLGKIGELLGHPEVCSIPRGKNAKSPSISYVNAGDTYSTTMMWVNGRFKVGNWGTIVERGNYN
jgi:hypothetical protein